MENYKTKAEIMKINLIVKNCWWFWGKTRKNQGKQVAELASKLMCLEFNEIRGKEKDD